MSNKKTATMPADHPDQSSDQMAELKHQVRDLQEQVLRARADYQNLVRRTQDDRQKLVQLASRELMEAIIVPLEHLEMAARQLSDQGLQMVVDQFKRTLSEFGLEEVNPEGAEFDPSLMEAVSGSSAETNVVKEVHSKGYKLNGQVIRHAKVIVA